MGHGLWRQSADITQPAMEQDGKVSEIIKTAGTFFVVIWDVRIEHEVWGVTDHCVRGNQSHREGPLRSPRARQSGCATHSLICKWGGGLLQ